MYPCLLHVYSCPSPSAHKKHTRHTSVEYFQWQFLSTLLLPSFFPFGIWHFTFCVCNGPSLPFRVVPYLIVPCLRMYPHTCIAWHVRILIDRNTYIHTNLPGRGCSGFVHLTCIFLSSINKESQIVPTCTIPPRCLFFCACAWCLVPGPQRQTKSNINANAILLFSSSFVCVLQDIPIFPL